MITSIRFLIVALFAFACLPTPAANAAAATPSPPPNVLLILADDLGYADLGCYGSEIQTPNLDALASAGLRFTRFHNTARCWPTRAALLTGFYAQQVGRDVLPGLKRADRPPWAKLLPHFLKSKKYRAYHSGKWHLDLTPLVTGFDRSYYVRDQDRFFTPRLHFRDDKKIPQPKTADNYYATTAIADHAVKVLRDHARQSPDKPFFHYLAFTAPHFPLHALPEDIKHYHGKYDAGWDAIRAMRWIKQQQLGVASGAISPVQPAVGPPYDFPDDLQTLGPNEVNQPVPWNSLTPAQKKFQATKMEIHAAMIHRMDLEIGRVIRQLKNMGAFDNTLIFFLSDNGASAEIMVRADGHNPKAAPGSANSYLCLGPGWSTVSNTPYRYHKTWTHQGGVATPLIAHWPKGITDQNALRQTPGHVVDILPTILELAGVSKKWPAPSKPDRVAAPGRSLVPAFTKDVTIERDFLWWAHDNHRAVLVGDWKLVAVKDGEWELYDLGADPNETHDLAARYPERVDQLKMRWKKLANQIAAAAAPGARQ
jgi:arylsulfatase